MFSMIPSSNQKNVKYPGNNITQRVLILHISLTTGDIFMMNSSYGRFPFEQKLLFKFPGISRGLRNSIFLSFRTRGQACEFGPNCPKFCSGSSSLLQEFPEFVVEWFAF